jgi:hypothetical protein
VQVYEKKLTKIEEKKVATSPLEIVESQGNTFSLSIEVAGVLSAASRNQFVLGIVG